MMELIINPYEDRRMLLSILADNGYAVLVEERKDKEDQFKTDMVVQIRTSL
jgi:hypothetical protein